MYCWMQRTGVRCSQWIAGISRVNGLLACKVARNAKAHATLVVGFLGRGQVEIGNRNLLGPLWTKVPQRLSNNRVVLRLFPMLIPKHENSWRNDRITLWLRTRSRIRVPSLRRSGSVRVLIAIRLFLAKQSLLLQAPLVHLVGPCVLVVVIGVELLIILVPPPPWIVIS